jgi:hypothetical protein
VAIKYGELCDGDELGMEEASQMRQRIGFSDHYASALAANIPRRLVVTDRIDSLGLATGVTSRVSNKTSEK